MRAVMHYFRVLRRILKLLSEAPSTPPAAAGATPGAVIVRYCR
jgi:hypothetical protein